MLHKIFEALQASNLGLAESLLSQLLFMEPENPIALELMGIVCGMQKNHEKALEFFKRGLALRPDDGSINFNIAKALSELKKYDQAVEHHIKSVQLDPKNFEAWLNYGLTLANLKRNEDALVCYDTALMLRPNLASAHFNKGLIYNELQMYERALESYAASYEFRTDGTGYLLGLICSLHLRLCQWDALNRIRESISLALAKNQNIADPFSISLIADDPFLILKGSEIYSKEIYPEIKESSPIFVSRHQKIKVAYFSADFRIHPVAQLIAELFDLHDRAHFELYAFSLRDPDQDDKVRTRLKSSFNHFYTLENKTDIEIANLARELEIDIAVDLGGFTQYARTGIFTHRVAPIQVNYLGYPGTMGATYMDYIVADAILIPETNQDFYTEKVVYLPDTYQPNDRKRQISVRKFTKSELGLPEQGFIFSCFNNNFKINPQVFDGWARILARVPGSVLWLLEDNPVAKENLQKEAIARGIDKDRLIFAGRLETSEHLARHALADLFLDTFPYNAHTTASDALWVGLPVLTLIGQSFAARVAASLLNAIDLPELITHSQAEYESLAIELATHPEKLAQIKQKLEMNRLTKPLFDTPRYTKHIEAAYTLMYERYHSGLPPDHLYIEEAQKSQETRNYLS